MNTKTVKKNNSVCVCACARVLTTVEHCFHVQPFRQEQVGLAFEGLGGQIEALAPLALPLTEPHS